MSEDDSAYPAWSVGLASGGKVTAVHAADRKRVLLEFQRGEDEHKTTIVLSEAALSALVHLAVNKLGVALLVPAGTDDDAAPQEAGR